VILALLLLAAARPAPAGAPRDLASYLQTAEAYADEDRGAAVREIRSWPPEAMRMAVADLEGHREKLRPDEEGSGTISARTVDAAVLMHAEAGLLAMQDGSTDEADRHLKAAVELRGWLVRVASEARRRPRSRRQKEARTDGLGPAAGREEDVRTRIAADSLNLALAAGALAAGSAATAFPLVISVPGIDADVLLVDGAVAEGLAATERIRGRTSQEEHWREQATRWLATAIRQYDALAPVRPRPPARRTEALLRLARLSLERGWLPQARKGLAGVEKAGDDRQRYLARLLLGRVAEREGKTAEAIDWYRRALAEWPEGQSAALALAHATERASGAAAARPVVEAALARPLRKNGRGDPWRAYLFGPPGLADELFDELRREALGP
jgi:hypothetical protein